MGVIEWATMHKDDCRTPPEEDDSVERKTDNISPADAKFIRVEIVEMETLFELILAANYLDVKGLLDLTCKALANKIKGKSVEELRDTFNFEDLSLTATLEEQV